MLTLNIVAWVFDVFGIVSYVISRFAVLSASHKRLMENVADAIVGIHVSLMIFLFVDDMQGFHDPSDLQEWNNIKQQF